MMFIVAGYARTGTSILFKCLEKSGLFGGTKEQLYGHHYKSQHKEFNDINKQILLWAMQKDMTVPVRKWQIPEQIHPILNELGREMEKQGINIVKDPQAGPVMQLWIDIVPYFQKPKFIRIEREPLEVGKSCIRLWMDQGWIKKTKVQDVVERYKFENKLWDLTCEPYETLRLQYKDLFNMNGKKDEISEFIGMEFDTSLIDPEKTFVASRKIY